MLSYKKGVIYMTVSDKNTRTNITFSKELKKRLEELAKQENRSFNNMVITILESYLKSIKK
jgi:predicted DNA-binding protein